MFFLRICVLCEAKWHRCEMNQFFMLLVKFIIKIVKYFFGFGTKDILNNKIKKWGGYGGGFSIYIKILSVSRSRVGGGRHS